jgi:hypothetical protein
MSDPAERALAKVEEGFEVTAEVDLHEDRTRENRTPGFSRMRTEWESADAAVVASVMGIVQNRIVANFASAFAIMNELYEIVREPVYDGNGEILKDAYGFTIWRQTPSGSYMEDYSRLGHKERENLLFEITTNIFAWEQAAANAWGEAMFAKAQFEERFALTFQDTPGSRPTVDDRTQHARSEAREERYYAIFQSLYSRKADAIVRSMQLLGQRLKDVIS